MATPVPSELVDAARTGGRDEIELLLRTVWPDAYRLARVILGEDQPAEDAAQEACIIVYRTIASLRSSAAFRTWFYRIVVREAAEIKRRRSRTESLEPRDRVGLGDTGRHRALPAHDRQTTLAPTLGRVQRTFLPVFGRGTNECNMISSLRARPRAKRSRCR